MIALTKISHPNVVKLYDVDEVDGQLCYAMELLTASSLAHVLKENGAFPTELAVSILDQLLDALDTIHDAGLVHRDIKPANIMLEEGGRTVLMDFGLVRHQKGGGMAVLTGAGVVVGTPRYLAPEILRGKEAGPRSDLYALGVVAYELLAGEHPFEHPNVSAMLAAVLNHEPEPLEERRPDVPPALAAWIARCMQKNPDDRFPEAAEAHESLGEVIDQLAHAEALERGLSSLVVAGRSLAGMRRSMVGRGSLARARRRGRRHLARALVGLAIAMVFVVALCYGAWITVAALQASR
jgi:serine/threonine protein kinase